jgi:hypothetical protein
MGLWPWLTYVLTDPARRGREAPRAKRALRKMFGISMPFCLIPCRLLALAAMGIMGGRPRGTGLRGIVVVVQKSQNTHMKGRALRGSRGKSIGIGLCFSFGPHGSPKAPQDRNFLGRTQQACWPNTRMQRRVEEETIEEALRPAYAHLCYSSRAALSRSSRASSSGCQRHPYATVRFHFLSGSSTSHCPPACFSNSSSASHSQ